MEASALAFSDSLGAAVAGHNTEGHTKGGVGIGVVVGSVVVDGAGLGDCFALGAILSNSFN